MSVPRSQKWVIFVFLSFPVFGYPQDSQDLASMGLSAVAQRPAAQSFTLENPLTGAPVNLDSFQGRYVLLNFWATWCGPCLKEMPSLDRLAKLVPGRKLVILGVSTGEKKETVSAFLRKSPHDFTVLVDPAQTVSGKYGVRAMPTTYLIDPQGRVMGSMSGPSDWDSPAFVKGFARLSK